MRRMEFGIFSPAPVQFLPNAGYVISVSIFTPRDIVAYLVVLNYNNHLVYIHFPTQNSSHPARDGFTVKLMTLKLQGPSLARIPFKALGGALAVPWKCPETSQLIYIYIYKKRGRRFPKFDNNHENLHDIANNEL
jgi:hypothetical protein